MTRPAHFLSIVAISAAVLLSACGGGSDGGTGTVSIGVTDAPVDQASAVVVRFTGVALKPANGDEIVFNFDSPRSIDLLNLQAGAAAALLAGQNVPAGRYTWMRLLVEAQRDTLDSYVTLTGGGQRSLFIPSGAETGLKLVSGFIVPVNGEASFTIDFDLRKSVFAPQGINTDYVLRPALRVVNNAEVGAIGGTVSSATLADTSCQTSDAVNVVYVFSGSTTPDDSDGDASDPVTTAAVTQDGSGTFSYRAAFLSPGTYTVAFTCQGSSDDPGTDNSLTFLGTQIVTVSNGSTTNANF